MKLTAFSQTDTSTNTKTFPIPVVRLIMKDLISGDSAKAELKLTEKQLLETEKKVIIKDSIINLLREKETKYKTIMDLQHEKYVMQRRYSDKLEIDLKKQIVKNKFGTVLGIGVIGLLTFLLIVK
jgi:hypothetical protein